MSSSDETSNLKKRDAPDIPDSDSSARASSLDASSSPRPSVPTFGSGTFMGAGAAPELPAPLRAAGNSGNTAAPASNAPPDPGAQTALMSDARTPVPRGVLVPGEQFGVYRVGQCIGEGGMARIYQAEHAGLRRQVALKVLLDASTRIPEGRERFLREARIAAAIKHPNVVNIFDVGVYEDTAYLVMELLKGIDLEQLIASRGPLDESTIVDIMVPVVAGLSAVHDAGVVHRDLKPGNVFLAQGLYDEVDPKLLDFGICKAPGPEQLRLTANGMLIGTPFYMSPEGLRGEEMTPQSDQYSLGVVMYECATGTNPFGANTFAEIFKLIAAGEYPPPTSSRPQISKRLERIIMRAMSLDPALRFKDLREMGRELLQLAGQRTRITWSLSFGEVERPKSSAINEWQVPQRTVPSTLPAANAGPPRRNRALFVIPALLLGLALLSAWAFVPAPAPKARPAAAHPRRSPNEVPSTSVLGASDPNPPASADAALRARPSLDASAKSSARVSPRRQIPLGRPPAPRTEDSDPEWAIPPATSVSPSKPSPGRAQSSVGTNGAPIFD